jgi:hypothetical protein
MSRTNETEDRKTYVNYMINFKFTIENVFADRFENIKCWTGKTFIEHKYWELQIMKDSDLISVDIRLTRKQDHAGFDLWMGLIGYAVNFKIYDHRHWDYETGSWAVYNE